jgi:uncharacterized protein YjcR
MAQKIFYRSQKSEVASFEGEKSIHAMKIKKEIIKYRLHRKRLELMQFYYANASQGLYPKGESVRCGGEYEKSG